MEHGTDMPIAMVTPQAGGAQEVKYVHVDRQGSVLALSSATGALVEGPYTYDPYGVSADASVGFPFRYTARRLDPEMGLYYYRARNYSASLGRFLQTDPIGYQDQMNLYGYVGNDPLNKNDPSGECAVVCGFIVGAVIGGGVNVFMQYTTKGSVNWKEAGEATVEGAITGTLVSLGVPPPVATAIGASWASVGRDWLEGKLTDVRSGAQSGVKAVLKTSVAVLGGRGGKFLASGPTGRGVASKAGNAAQNTTDDFVDGLVRGVKTYNFTKEKLGEVAGGIVTYAGGAASKPVSDALEEVAGQVVDTVDWAVRRGEEIARSRGRQ